MINMINSAVFLIAEFQAIITVLSLSAIVTNGNMRGGGSYYMISRTLGPEFGGSIGLLFYAAYCVGVAFYCTGFAEELVDTWYDDLTGTTKHWYIILWASVVCLICLAIALAGARWFTKINVFLFFWQFLAILIALLACFFRGTFFLEGHSKDNYQCNDSQPYEYYKHYAWTWDNFTEMWSVTGGANFAITFGVLFPAATGIMEGANLSGDLANPTYSIPVGTLSAVGTSIFFYALLIFSFAGSFNQCTLRNDTTIMQEAAWGNVGTYLVVAGIMISASSSALGSLFGGSRVLQAIARDKLFPYTQWFEYGSKKGDEPLTCVLITWIIAQSLIFIGSINAIAPISTSFFCLSYCTVNFSCFLLEISGTPNFRPSFTYYTWHTCLLGTLSNLAVMFFVDYRFGLAALICEIAVFVFLAYRAPQNVWGDVTQSIIFHQVRKYLLRLDSRKAHSKTWRPSILLLADSEEIALIDFCNNLKKGGLYIIGTTIIGDFADNVEVTRRIKQDWVEFVDRNSLKAFPQIAVSNSLRAGYENLILLSGLGAMEPNTIVLPMLRIKQPDNKDKNKSKQYQKLKKRGGKNKNDIEEDIDDDEEEEEEEEEEEQKNDQLAIAMEEKHNNDNDDSFNNALSLDNNDGNDNNNYLLPKRQSIAMESLKTLVRLSPAEMDPVEYIKLCTNILKFNRNIVMTANIHSLDFQLVISQNIAQVIEKRKTDKNGLGGSGLNDVSPPHVDTSKGNLQIDSQSLNEQRDINKLSAKSVDSSFIEDSRMSETVMTQTSINNSATNYWTFTSHQTPNIRNQWVDIWLFADDYTFDLNDTTKDYGFPMLIMQLAHILLQNKVWDKAAGLRVFLLVNNKWNESDQLNFDTIVKDLRLGIDQVVVLKQPTMKKPSWKSIINNKMKKKHLKKYYSTLNSTMVSLSSQTYFTFLKLPQLPPTEDIDDNEMNIKLSRMYFESMYILLKQMPPTALIATGEELPVISMDI